MKDEFPAWRYGPNGQSQIFRNEDEVPEGWADHPSKIETAAGAETGTRTATESANGPRVSERQAARTIDAASQTHTDPAKAARSGVGAAGTTDPADTAKSPALTENATSPELDAHGHPWSADLYAPTKTKTRAGLWRMKVGKSRPEALPGYPLDL